MTRRTVEMRPQMMVLKQKLSNMATILSSDEAPQPILPPSIRAAVHQWMTEIRAEEELSAVGVQPRRSALLSGPPGCGKTTLAHHLAARLGVDLVCVHMDRLRSKWCGQTGENIATLFESLEQSSSESLLFFDEFDAVAQKRSEEGTGATEERNSIVNALLARIEAFKGNMIAATNRATALDPAIWRRFGMQLEIPLPGPDERYAIMAFYLHPFTISEAAMDYLTAATDGAAPSLLRQLMEGIKRDMILAPRMNNPTDAKATFFRIIASVAPHPDYNVPYLWAETSAALHNLAKFPWPPERKAA